MFSRKARVWLNLLLAAGVLLLAGHRWRQVSRARADTAPGACAATSPGEPRTSRGASPPVVSPARKRRLVGYPPAADANVEGGWGNLPPRPSFDMTDEGDVFQLLLSAGRLDPESVRIHLDGQVLVVTARRLHAGGTEPLVSRIMLPVPPDTAATPRFIMTNGALCIHVRKECCR